MKRLFKDQRASFARKHVSGFSLMEILLGLGIAAGIIVAAFMIYPKVQSARSVNQEAANLATISSNVIDLYKNSGDYGGISNAMLIKAGAFPSNMVAADGVTVTNVWGGAVTVIPSPYISRGFQIQESHVPTNECDRLAAAAEAGFDSVRINGWFPKTSTTTFNISNTLLQPCFDTPYNNLISFDRH